MYMKRNTFVCALKKHKCESFCGSWNTSVNPSVCMCVLWDCSEPICNSYPFDGKQNGESNLLYTCLKNKTLYTLRKHITKLLYTVVIIWLNVLKWLPSTLDHPRVPLCWEPTVWSEPLTAAASTSSISTHSNTHSKYVSDKPTLIHLLQYITLPLLPLF